MLYIYGLVSMRALSGCVVRGCHCGGTGGGSKKLRDQEDDANLFTRQTKRDRERARVTHILQRR